MITANADSATNAAGRLPQALQSSLLATIPYVRHGLTYRVEGLGKADGNIGLGTPRDREDAWEMRKLWCASVDLDPEQIVTMGQVHGNEVITVRSGDAGTGARDPGKHVGYADALITNEPGVVLMTLHADCQPILMIDPVRRAVAAVHAGWRGTVADVGGATVRAMQEAYGTNPADILAYLGPAIGPEQNEVGDEVIDSWLAQASDLGDEAQSAIRKPGAKYHFDVPRANTLLLLRAGLQRQHLDVSSICTKTCKHDWFSHRGHGPNAGREGAMISLVSEVQ